MEHRKQLEAAVSELLALATRTGTLDTEALDERVHEAASEIASDVNNQGTEAQIRYLLAHYGLEGVEEIKRQSVIL